ncbi:MAG TPA: hypothetical protein VFJ62_12650 [Usitatibacter sp.]|nr:hypothetical protein [Usitatibacter sp.]
MIEKHFYADVDTPFHVWVRERSDAHGFRWVLRDASQLGDASAAPRPMHAANAPRRRGGTTAGDCAD